MSFSNAAFSDSFGLGFDRVEPPALVVPVISGTRLFIVEPEDRAFIVAAEDSVFTVVE
jgi:hypothetical protein